MDAFKDDGCKRCKILRSESESKDQSFLKLLECPICLEVPRTGPIFNCGNGHILCHKCHLQVGQKPCSICRHDGPKARNLFAEAAVEGIKTMLECGNKASGCSFQALASQLSDHEDACPFRQIICPGHIRGACKWTGNIRDLGNHIKGSQCMQILKEKPDESGFTSVICDYPLPKQSVLETFGKKTHWKPTLLASKNTIGYFPMVLITRSSNSEWMIYVKALMGHTKSENVKICFRVYSADNDEQHQSLAFSFEGRMLPYDFTESEVISSGSFMCLSDHQIRKLQVNKSLFAYKIELIPLATN